MAPEQVAGDPNVDHRADIYSLGCVGYEMLTGQSPFAGKSPQQMLAAHVMEKPAPLASRRADIPPSLIALIDRCLEKEPSARPQSATELVTQLQASGTHDTPALPAASRQRSRVPTWAIVGGLVVLGAAAVPGYRAMRRAPVADGSLTIAVAPFEVLDPQLALWKEGIVDVLSRNLDGAGPIRSIPPSASIKKWEGHADRTVATAFGKRVGAQLVVYGQLQPAGRDLVDAKVWIVDTQRDAAPTELQFRDSVARMDRVTDSLSVKVLAAIGRSRGIGAGRVASLGSGSLPAIKAFFRDRSTSVARSGIPLRRRSRKPSRSTRRSASPIYISRNPAGGRADRETLRPPTRIERPEPSCAQACRRATRCCSRPRATMLARAQWCDATPRRRGKRSRRCRLRSSDTQTIPKPGICSATCAITAIERITDREALNYFDHAIAADSDFAPAYIHAIELALSIWRGDRTAVRRRISAARPARLRGRRNSTRGARVESADQAGAAQSGDRHASGTRRSEGVPAISRMPDTAEAGAASSPTRTTARAEREFDALPEYSARQSARDAWAHPRGVAAGHREQELSGRRDRGTGSDSRGQCRRSWCGRFSTRGTTRS